MSQSPALRLFEAVLVTFLISLIVAGSAAAKGSECAIQADSGAAASAVTSKATAKPPVVLEILKQSEQVINFGDGRGVKLDHIVARSDDPLPEIKPGQIEWNTLEPMKRIGSGKYESTQLEKPSISNPRVFKNDREKLSFDICVSAADGEPGTYTGQFLLSGPAGMSLTVSQTAQLKESGWLFYTGLGVILLVTALFLWVKVGHDLKDQSKRFARTLVVLASLVVAGGAMALIYDNDPSWGAERLSAWTAVVAAGLSAAGLGTGLTGVVNSLTGKKEEGEEEEGEEEELGEGEEEGGGEEGEGGDQPPTP